MNKFILSILLAAIAAGSVATAEAKPKYKKHDQDRVVVVRDHDIRRYNDKYKYSQHRNYRDRQRTIYVIERNRPVRRVVYVSPSGSYYRILNGRRVYVRARHYTSYPSRYYYADGRPRVGVSISF